MAALLFVVFIVVPIVELYVIVQVAQAIGALETIALLIFEAILGTWLLKQQGMAAWNRFRRSLEQGRVPTEEISDGALIMFGGALLLTPGFVTDVLGFVLLFPPTRVLVKKAGARAIKRRVLRRTGVARYYDARVVRNERNVTPSRPSPRDASPSDTHPEALEDGSPDKG